MIPLPPTYLSLLLYEFVFSELKKLIYYLLLHHPATVKSEPISMFPFGGSIHRLALVLIKAEF